MGSKNDYVRLSDKEEGGMTYFMVLSRHSPGRTEANLSSTIVRTLTARQTLSMVQPEFEFPPHRLPGSINLGGISR
jgi:hypothetical protein